MYINIYTEARVYIDVTYQPPTHNPGKMAWSQTNSDNIS